MFFGAAKLLLDNHYENVTVSETDSLLYQIGNASELSQKYSWTRVHFPGGWATATPNENNDGHVFISKACAACIQVPDLLKNQDQFSCLLTDGMGDAITPIDHKHSQGLWELRTAQKRC